MTRRPPSQDPIQILMGDMNNKPYRSSSSSSSSRLQEPQYGSQQRDNYGSGSQSKSWNDHQREMENMRDSSRNERSQNYDPRTPRSTHSHKTDHSYNQHNKSGQRPEDFMGLDDNRSAYKQGGGVHAAAQKLKHMGRDGDTDLVHVNEEEKRMLKAIGGRGSINSKTGLREYMFNDAATEERWRNQQQQQAVQPPMGQQKYKTQLDRLEKYINRNDQTDNDSNAGIVKGLNRARGEYHSLAGKPFESIRDLDRQAQNQWQQGKQPKSKQGNALPEKLKVPPKGYAPFQSDNHKCLMNSLRDVHNIRQLNQGVNLQEPQGGKLSEENLSDHANYRAEYSNNKKNMLDRFKATKQTLGGYDMHNEKKLLGIKADDYYGHGDDDGGKLKAGSKKASQEAPSTVRNGLLTARKNRWATILSRDEGNGAEHAVTGFNFSPSRERGKEKPLGQYATLMTNDHANPGHFFQKKAISPEGHMYDHADYKTWLAGEKKEKQPGHGDMHFNKYKSLITNIEDDKYNK